MSLMHCWVIDVLHYCKDLKSLAQKSQAKYKHHAFGMEVYDPKGEDTQELRKSYLTRMGRIAASSKSATIVLCSGYPVCQVNASNHRLILLRSFQEHHVNDERFQWAGQACTEASTTSHELSVGEDLQAIPHDRIPHVISPATKAEPESGGIYTTCVPHGRREPIIVVTYLSCMSMMGCFQMARKDFINHILSDSL